VAINLSTYRDELEEMTAEVLEEEYLHASGRKATMELARVYERHSDLTTLTTAVELAGMGAPTELQRFAAEAYIGDGLKDLTDRKANLEASAVVQFDGEAVPYRGVRPRLMNEPDHARRHELHRLRCEVTEREINPVLGERMERQRELVADLGAPSLRALYEQFGYNPAGLAVKTERFLSATESTHRRELDRALRERVGIDPAEATAADIARLMRAPEFDAGFPPDRALPALRATLEGLGIAIDEQRNVELDVKPRPGKVPRAFCAPIRVPDRVVLVTLPQGGQEDYLALFHEAGHTEHFAHASRSLPAEDRLLGDNAVTEGFAFLLEHLVTDPRWLSTRLDMPGADEYVRFAAFSKLLLIRRYSAKLAYELELHGAAPLEGLPSRYAELLGHAVGVPYPTSDYLDDVDPGFYCTCYLRAWAFEAQLGDWLREQFGADWFRNRRAGSLLREVWELGQSLNAEQLLREVTGQELDFDVLAEQARRDLG
jgi:hypothetical protein